MIVEKSLTSLTSPTDCPATSKAAPPERERVRIVEARKRADERTQRNPVKMHAGRSELGGLEVEPPHSDVEGWSLRLLDTFGTLSNDFATNQVRTLEHVTRPRGAAASQDTGVEHLNAALAIVNAVAPENELEAALAVQLASNHALVLDVAERAKHADRVDHLQTYGNLAVKLQRTFTAQIEALARLRGKGQQTVRVEHVNVHPGGQAIVGDVYHQPGGRGQQAKAGRQSHAHPSDAPIGSLPGADPQGEPMPITRNAEREMSHARRDEPRGAEG